MSMSSLMRKVMHLTLPSIPRDMSNRTRTLFQGLYGHFPVLRGPQSLPHLSKVSLSQLLVEPELLSRSLPRLHVEQLPLHRDDRVSPHNLKSNRLRHKPSPMCISRVFTCPNTEGCTVHFKSCFIYQNHVGLGGNMRA